MKWYRSKIGLTLAVIYLIAWFGLRIFGFLLSFIPGGSGGILAFWYYGLIVLSFPLALINISVPVSPEWAIIFDLFVVGLLNAIFYYLVGVIIERLRKRSKQ